MPRISVILTAYNREAMVGAAIDSILAQTFQDFEIIVVDDGSTDRTVEIVNAVNDRRVRLIAHPHNLGTPTARNSGLEAATGDYIAWLDSDDLSRPRRLEVQAAYLDAHPSIAMIGSCAGSIRENGRRGWVPRSRPSTHEQLAAMLLFRSALLQSTIMGRAEILKQYPYRLEFPVCQDLDMFIRLTREHRVANLKEVLVDRRFHEGQVVRRRAALIVDRKRVLFGESLARLGIEPDREELDRHILLGRIKKSPVDREFLEWSRDWLDRVAAANRSRGIYDEQGLDYTLKRVWQRACAAALRGPDRLYAATQFWSYRRHSLADRHAVQ
jgi:glycosyltransferase involved in cell wall biosynthesis